MFMYTPTKKTDTSITCQGETPYILNLIIQVLLTVWRYDDKIPKMCNHEVHLL